MVDYFPFLVISDKADLVDANYICSVTYLKLKVSRSIIVFIKNCIKLVKSLDIIWPCILIIMIIT